MFKRVERKRKRREEEDELRLDEEMKEIMGLNDTDSDESDSGSGQSARSDSDDPGPGIGEERDQDEDAMSGDEDVNEDPPILVEEALKDPIYLISLDPTVHGCVLCKGKLIKNAGMATAHKTAKVHKRRFEHFKRLSADADPRSNAWELVKAIQSASSVQKSDLQEPSKRALKRQAKQVAIWEKRGRHKELRAKAIAKKALKKLSEAEETRPAAPSKANLRCSPGLQSQPRKTRKKQKLESKTSTSKARDVTPKSASRTKTPSDSKKSALGSGIKRKRKADRPS